MVYKPRDYQDYAIESPFRYFTEGGKGNPVIAMPTGTGKSIVIAEFVKRALQRYSGTRIIMLTHVKELIEQNYEKLLAVWPTAPAGIYSAGVGIKDTHCPITFAGIQSIHSKAKEFGHIDLLLIDECHLVPENSNTMYRKFINALIEINPFLKVIGLTATQYRMGLGLITEGAIFTDLCCDMTTLESFNWFIEEGYLCELIPKPTNVEIDTSTVAKRGGEFVAKDLQAASDKEYITKAAVQEMCEVAWDRHHWLIFGTGVDHCNHIVTELLNQGIGAVAVHSKMSASQRDENIRLFKSGEVRALVNMGVLTTGFDSPFVDMLGLLRATQSPGLYVQICGRGTRPYYADGYDLTTKEGRLSAIANSEKPNCLVLDFAGNVRRLGPINDPKLPKRKGKGGEDAPVRLCETCNTYIHASLVVCPHCGKEYPPQVKFAADANTDEVIAKKRKEREPPLVQVFAVDLVTFKYEFSRGKGTPYIRITYGSGLRSFSQPLCLEHKGFARKKSRDWWRKATGVQDNVPETVVEALDRQDECRTPKNIRVHVNTKYPEIMYIDYDGDLDDEAGKDPS